MTRPTPPPRPAPFSRPGPTPDGGWLSVGRSPDALHIAVAGGPGKHSAFIPSFGGTTVACTRITS